MFSSVPPIMYTVLYTVQCTYNNVVFTTKLYNVEINHYCLSIIKLVPYAALTPPIQPLEKVLRLWKDLFFTAH